MKKLLILLSVLLLIGSCKKDEVVNPVIPPPIYHIPQHYLKITGHSYTEAIVFEDEVNQVGHGTRIVNPSDFTWDGQQNWLNKEFTIDSGHYIYFDFQPLNNSINVYKIVEYSNSSFSTPTHTYLDLDTIGNCYGCPGIDTSVTIHY